jgi:hypothetical protein
VGASLFDSSVQAEQIISCPAKRQFKKLAQLALRHPGIRIFQNLLAKPNLIQETLSVISPGLEGATKSSQITNPQELSVL